MDATCITSSALSTCDHPTSMERDKSEVSSVPEGSPVDGDGGGVSFEKEGGAEEEDEEEDDEEEVEEEDPRKWGALKTPVTVKIADLGNACWVVS